MVLDLNSCVSGVFLVSFRCDFKRVFGVRLAEISAFFRVRGMYHCQLADSGF